MTYHIEIAVERRSDPARMAIPIGSVGVDDEPGPTHLHTMSSADLRRVVGEDTLALDFSDPQFVMVAEWDMKSPYVICHKGDYSAVTMRYAGWPDVTQAEYEAQEVLEGRT